jgi:hypothetical protein
MIRQARGTRGARNAAATNGEMEEARLRKAAGKERAQGSREK